ncbi:hypothetical protein PC9H_008472 [Pleurotus ostreatus]|uniref:Hydrophobin n=1 Tax=Pleurotus ostreatus TaxID=5322 RepID=A0A8H7DT48_PLEOS|nr:uncharacterized protein PC9H_008472 [Pleurotus ostreatus]KAF7426106.1 hypothetical protein PC9H_008472 [Pleurotus ostreatus]
MKFFSATILSLFVAVVAAQDGLDFGGQCGTFVGTKPCKAGLKCCYIGPDNGFLGARSRAAKLSKASPAYSSHKHIAMSAGSASVGALRLKHKEPTANELYHVPISTQSPL